MPSVFITGASGFIGRHLARRLAQEGYSLRCLVRKTSQTTHLKALDAQLLTTNILDTDRLTHDLEGCQYVFHIAGMTCAFTPNDLMRVNGEGSAALAEACARQANAPTVVVVSSLSAAGPSPDGHPLSENYFPRPISNYGRSKRAGEQAFERRASEVPTTIVRPGIVFGEENVEMFPMFQSIWQTGIHAVPGLNTPRRVSLIHVTDLVELIVQAAFRGRRISKLPGDERFAGSGYYFAADDQMPRYDELGRMIQRSLGAKRCLSVRIPAPVLWGVGWCSETLARWKGKPTIVNRDKAGEGLAGDWICTSQRAHEELEFAPAAPLQERLDQTGTWYREQGWL